MSETTKYYELKEGMLNALPVKSQQIVLAYFKEVHLPSKMSVDSFIENLRNSEQSYIKDMVAEYPNSLKKCLEEFVLSQQPKVVVSERELNFGGEIKRLNDKVTFLLRKRAQDMETIAKLWESKFSNKAPRCNQHECDAAKLISHKWL